ncbi:MAG: universal stress protein [Thermoflexales bacterium]
MYHNILVPLDGSDLGEAALATATDIARCSGSSVTLVQVPDHSMMEYYIDQPVVLADLRSRDAERAREYLDAIAARLRLDGLTVVTRVMDGAVADAILDVANSESVDLIAMATHGRSGIGRFLLGSVADRVTTHADVPVILVRPASGPPKTESKPEAKSVG